MKHFYSMTPQGQSELRSRTRSKVKFNVEQVGQVRETLALSLTMRSVLQNILLILTGVCTGFIY
jgi:hypothetical protein